MDGKRVPKNALRALRIFSLWKRSFGVNFLKLLHFQFHYDEMVGKCELPSVIL